MKEIVVPDFPCYFVNEAGEVISYARTGIRKVKKPKEIQRKGCKPRHQIVLHHEGVSRNVLVSRTVMAAMLGRWPEPWEVVRHMDENPANNAPANLKIGCPLLNVLDDIENGSRETNDAYIDEAIARLIAIKEARS